MPMCLRIEPRQFVEAPVWAPHPGRPLPPILPFSSLMENLHIPRRHAPSDASAESPLPSSDPGSRICDAPLLSMPVAVLCSFSTLYTFLKLESQPGATRLGGGQLPAQSPLPHVLCRRPVQPVGMSVRTRGTLRSHKWPGQVAEARGLF